MDGLPNTDCKAIGQGLKRLTLLAVVLLALSGFSKQKNVDPGAGQPPEERKAQEALPQSKDPIWKVLGKTKVHLDAKEWHYSAEFPPEVKAMVGKPITITGFVLPLDATEEFKHFIISKRTPTCAFCPPGEPNEIADVWLDKPMKWDQDAVTVTGTFELMDNDQLGLFFKISHAVRK